MNKTGEPCHIYQIYYCEEQKIHLENEFISYDNSHSLTPELCEYGVFRENYIKNTHKNALLTGFLSWKFKAKTNVTGNKFIDFIESNPGYDVYYINPFPYEEKFLSVWEQADTHHPDIVSLTQNIFDAIGYNIDLRKIDNLSLTSAYCNYWVGTQKFWDTYMGFSEPIYDYIMNQAPSQIRNKIFERADKIIEASYFPFIFERIFSTLLYTNKNIKACRYEYSFDELKLRYNESIADLLLALKNLDQGNNSRARDFICKNLDLNMDSLKQFVKKKDALIYSLRKLKQYFFLNKIVMYLQSIKKLFKQSL